MTFQKWYKLSNLQFRRYWIGGGVGITLLTVFSCVILIPNTTIQQLSQQLPFPLFVSTIALADGLNPCAFTVLIILLSLLTYTKKQGELLSN